MNKLNIDKYIERIGFSGDIEISVECFKELHKCHVMSIPFEAIDVELGRHIDLNLDKIFNKVVINNRGGYCYELNFLFQKLLTKVGFESYLISASIFDNEKFGPEYDHMAVVVKLDDFWLADVGYGDLFIKPLQIKSGIQQTDELKIYEIKEPKLNEYILTESLKDKMEFRVKYKFNISPKKVQDFEEQNEWKQSAKESYFVNNRICTLPSKNGRKTILNNTYKVKANGQIEKQLIDEETRLKEILKNEFRIVIENTPYNKA